MNKEVKELKAKYGQVEITFYVLEYYVNCFISRWLKKEKKWRLMEGGRADDPDTAFQEAYKKVI